MGQKLTALYNALIENELGGTPEQIRAERKAKLQQTIAGGNVASANSDAAQSNQRLLPKQEQVASNELDSKIKNAERDNRLADMEAAGKEGEMVSKALARNVHNAMLKQLEKYTNMSAADLQAAGISVTLGSDGMPKYTYNSKKNVFAYDQATSELNKVGEVGKNDVIKNSGLNPNQIETHARKQANAEANEGKSGFDDWTAASQAKIDKHRKMLMSKYSPSQRAVIGNAISNKLEQTGLDFVRTYDSPEDIKEDIANGTLNAGDTILYNGSPITIGE